MTEQEFKDYIADEVLLAVKGEMQWEFTSVPADVEKRYTWSATRPTAGYTLTSLSSIGIELPDGATVQKVGGGTVTLTAPLFEDSTTMTVAIATTGGEYYYDKTETPYYRPQSVRAYEAILTETLVRLGATSISDVPVKKARDFGRREAWRHIMWATVGDYSYQSDTTSMDRAGNHQRAKEMFMRENDYINLHYFSASGGHLPATTQGATIRGVWK